MPQETSEATHRAVLLGNNKRFRGEETVINKEIKDLVSLETVFNDNPVRVFDMNGEPYFAIVDLSKAWGLHRDTLRNKIQDNSELFEGHIITLDGVTPSLILTEERGMYMLMAKLTVSRVKNPDAKKFILAFQKFVPELLQKFRKGELLVRDTYQVLPSGAYTYFEQQMGMAKIMHETMGVNLGIAGARTISYVEEKTGIKFDLQRDLLPTYNQLEIGFMNATNLGERIGKKPEKTNSLLADMGLQYRQEKEWILTEEGQRYAEKKPFDVILPNGSKHSGFQNLWKESVIERIAEYQKEAGCDFKPTHSSELV